MKKNILIISCLVGFLLSGGMAHAQKGYRDLNKNGKMDPYENKALSAEERAKDLLSKMNLDEKIGTMFHTYTMLNKDGSIDDKAFMTGGLSTDKLVIENRMNHFNLVGDAPALSIARYNNMVQEIAENTRLGIPVTFSTDPRSSYKESDLSTTVSAGDLTAFPEPLGLGATNDTYTVYKSAQTMASEYRALGISMLLNPIADVATEPRWGRISGTFGEDAELASNMVKAYIKGFQGDQIDKKSVACVTKHFPGNGPQEDGWDGHFNYGRNLVYPGNNFEYHLRPFEAAIEAGSAGIMTCYGIPKGQFSKDIGSSFLKEIMTDLLKNKMGFTGFVVADWNTVTDKYVGGQRLIEVRSWGLENATVDERLQALVFAGVDQIGGETQTQPLKKLVEDGKIPMDIIDASVLKIMTLKFQLGLFDNPYVDEAKVSEIVGTKDNKKISQEAQLKSLVLLENKDKTYPLASGKKIYVEGYKNKEAFAKYGNIVNNMDECDFAIIRLTTPFSPPRNNNMLEAHFRQGTLAYNDSTSNAIVAKLNKKPCVVVMNLERAAVIPEVAKSAKVLIAEFGVSNEVIANAIFGKLRPQGRLPIELPSSMEAVEKQKEDVPYDSENPLYSFGFGL